MSKKLICAIVSAATGFVAVAQPSVWYVDDDNYGKGGTGSAENPFGTIQEAVNAASRTEVDTIWVRPGVYKEDESLGLDSTQRTRVIIDRKVNIFSTDGKSVTTILGSYGSVDRDGNSYDGRNGTNAQIAYAQDTVQCVLVDTAAAGSVIRGFTFRDGVTHQSRANGYAAGGICFRTPRFGNDFTVAFCDFVDCAGRAAGGMHGGVAIGCRFTGCWTLNAPNFGTAAYRISAYNCIFDSNGSRGQSNYAVQDPGILASCTIVNNYNKNGFNNQITDEGRGLYYNLACYDNCTQNGDALSEAHNCVFDQDISQFKAGSERVTSFVYSTAVKTNVCVCPVTQDFRPVVGGLLDGTGDPSYMALDFVPTEYRNVDFNGNAIASGAPIPIGALLPAANVESGALQLSGDYFSVNGADTATYPVYIQSAVWPAEVELGKASAKTQNFAGIKLGIVFQSKGQYETVWQLIPPKTDSEGAVAPVSVTMFKYSSNEPIYVGGDNAVDEAGSGTAEKPFATIQAALESMGTGSSNFRIVKVRPGHYREGAKVDTYGHRSRLAVPAGCYVHIMAEGGPADTFLHGEPDPDTKDCGANAVRCIGVPNNCTFVISGFTICDSYSADGAATLGAAMRGSSSGTDSNQKVYDCVFTGNHGLYCCGNQSVFFRCVFTNNVCTSGAVLINSYASGCVFANNEATGSANFPFGGSTHAYNCTLFEPKSNGPTYNTACRIINNVIDTCYTAYNHSSGGVVAGCVHNNVGHDSLTDPHNLKANPYLGAAWGDFRPLENSPVFGAGVATDETGISTTTLMGCYVRCDINNRPVALDGQVLSGAVAESRDIRTVYADAVNGSDTNDGLTEATAKKSLKAAVEIPCDGTVVALKGHYTNETMACAGAAVHDGTPTLKCRVIVPAGTTLVAKDGPEETFIEGAADSNEAADAKGAGRGPNAVRCVFLENGATVRGFTIMNGHTDSDDSNYYDDDFGGGVMGRSIAGTSVENCVVRDNRSACGGAGAYTTFRNCKLLDNRAYHFGGIARHVALYGCYVAGNRGANPVDVYTDVINCTFGEGNDNLGGTAAHILSNGGSSSRVWNCINLSAVSTGKMTQSGPDFRNCLFAKESVYDLGSKVKDVNFDYTRAELIAMFKDGIPKSKDTVTVDSGCSDAVALLAETDLAGNLRVMNRTIDVGCYEYDWRGDYAKSLGRRVAVTDASGTLEMTDGKTVFHDGDEMSVDWASGGKTVDYGISAVLNGTGTLTVYAADGTVVGTFTKSGSIAFASPLDVTSLRFAYASADGGTAYVDKMNRLGGVLLFVR